MPIVSVGESAGSGQRGDAAGEAEYSKSMARQLERGSILLFNQSPVKLNPDHIEYLLSQRQSDSRLHKNISYRPIENVLSGAGRGADTTEIKAIMQDYSERVTSFVSKFLSPYAAKWSLDFASFRPIEEEGRRMPIRKRNDLLHVDAFPTRPTNGARILRVFTNINQSRPRIWNTTSSFKELAERFASDAGLNKFGKNGGPGPVSIVSFARRVSSTLRLTPAGRSPYDSFMLGFHNYLKENASFQSTCDKERLEFPPGSTWLVFTDAVAHAVLSGQFALEQTYIIPRQALVEPESAPISILEKLCGQKLSLPARA